MAKLITKIKTLISSQIASSESTTLEQEEYQWVLAFIFRMGFNPITQTYEQSERGKKLQQYD